MQAGGRGILDAAQADPARPAAIFLGGDQNQALAERTAPAFAALLAADVDFIDFDGAAEPVAPRAHHRPSQFVQPDPSRLVAAQAQHSLQAKGAHARLLVRHIPHGPQPQAQWLVGVLEDRPGRDRSLMPAESTVQQPALDPPALRMTTSRAPEAIRPAQLDKVLAAGLLRREALFELQDGPGVVFHDPEPTSVAVLESTR